MDIFNSILKHLRPWLYGVGARPEDKSKPDIPQPKYDEPPIKKSALMRMNNSKDGRHPNIIIESTPKKDKQ